MHQRQATSAGEHGVVYLHFGVGPKPPYDAIRSRRSHKRILDSATWAVKPDTASIGGQNRASRDFQVTIANFDNAGVQHISNLELRPDEGLQDEAFQNQVVIGNTNRTYFIVVLQANRGPKSIRRSYG